MERINQIQPADQEAYEAAGAVWNSIAKPLGSFGTLEQMIQKIAAVQGTADVDISQRTAVIFCGDHGITEEGVTQCGCDVTAICAKEIAEGRSNINAIAALYQTDVFAVDVGIRDDVSSPRLIQRKIARGTANFAKSPAMTDSQTESAILIGMDAAAECRKAGTKILISGEMGIGNTTSAAALASVLLDLPPETVTGRGSGLSTEGLLRKIQTVSRGIEMHKPVKTQPMHLLKSLGGFEIAAMTGLFLGGAYERIPVIIDGVISAAAAAIAYQLNPICAEYMLASHCSEEPAAKGLLEFMHLKPVIHAGLRLGEGTGAILLLPLLDAALALYRNSHRFDEANIERYTEQK